jgi:predicted transcriptional regulator
LVENDLKEMTAQIVTAYVEHNSLAIGDLPALIGSIYKSLSTVAQPHLDPPASAPKATSAQIRKSVSPDALVSFEDGRPYKSLKRHLRGHGLTPEEYRAKWGLASDYPMVAASYSAARSALAKSMGLGNKAKQAAPQLKPAKVRKPRVVKTPATAGAIRA